MAYNSPKGIIAASVILELLAVSCVGLRLLARRKRKAPLIVSNWLILASLICATGLTVTEIYGAAVQALSVPLNATIEDPKAVDGRLNKTKHIELSFLILGIFTLGLIKLSVSFLYYRIFEKPSFRYVVVAWIIVILAWTASFVVAGLAECGSHLKAIFGTPQDYLERCGHAIPTGWAMVGSDVATDLITLVIPIPMVWSLQMPLHRRLLLLAIFMVGSLSVGASIGKTYIYVKSSLGLYSEDAIITLTGISIWNLIEVQVGIMAACGPTLRPILSDIIPTESLISLLDSIRSRLISSRNTSSGSVQRLPPFRKSAAKSECSDEHLVYPAQMDHQNRVEISTGDIELLGSNEQYAKMLKPGNVHVRKNVAVEHA